eukprot:CAMPEP_0118923462 /NCGR_PEP_ID=MMETSP1169-20130426/1975_1 /TAXON_ID=36882 /ORGANISM="Pyramimonas obovata, Strain CCMP722" /LENGTH=204 /DNA_ID=CAMNT_0006864447 /DNA_START=218 /DNA_END=829 /DNA_ORIENTATION=+
MAARRDVRDWANYEALIPRPSHSKAGKTVDARQYTIPQVRTFLRAEAYQRTVTQPQQATRDSLMAVPKVRNAEVGSGTSFRQKQRQRIHEAKTRTAEHVQRLKANEADKLIPSLSRRELPPVAAHRPRPMRETSRAAEDQWDESYSETPIHIREHQAKVFDLPKFVCKERAIITAGRTFTWGGRMKHQLPGYDPLRARNLTESK